MKKACESKPNKYEQVVKVVAYTTVIILTIFLIKVVLLAFHIMNAFGGGRL